MAPLGAECGDVEPFNIVGEEQMKTGFVSYSKAPFKLEIYFDILFRMMLVSVSVSASWNSSFTLHRPHVVTIIPCIKYL